MPIVPVDGELARLFIGGDVDRFFSHLIPVGARFAKHAKRSRLGRQDAAPTNMIYRDGVGGGTTARKFAAAQPARVLS